MPDLLAFAAPPPLAPPGASPLLAVILLGIDLCRNVDQLVQWWDWPAHRDAWWHLSAAEREYALATRHARHEALGAASAPQREPGC